MSSKLQFLLICSFYGKSQAFSFYMETSARPSERMKRNTVPGNENGGVLFRRVTWDSVFASQESRLTCLELGTKTENFIHKKRQYQ